ncbi:unnamed protein product [Coregonus sp. 'balchen']|nr:unnamed protein product [Coregonus sp. 'balchen']
MLQGSLAVDQRPFWEKTQKEIPAFGVSRSGDAKAQHPIIEPHESNMVSLHESNMLSLQESVFCEFAQWLHIYKKRKIKRILRFNSGCGGEAILGKDTERENSAVSGSHS